MGKGDPAKVSGIIFLTGLFDRPFYVGFISFIHCFIVILSWVYNQPAQRPAPSWLVSSIFVEHSVPVERSILYKPVFLSGSLFATAEVASIALIISFHLILDPAVHLYDIHISYFIVPHLLRGMT